MRGDDGGVFGALVCAGLDEFAVVDLDDAHGCSTAVVSVLARRLPPGEGQVGTQLHAAIGYSSIA